MKKVSCLFAKKRCSQDGIVMVEDGGIATFRYSGYITTTHYKIPLVFKLRNELELKKFIEGNDDFPKLWDGGSPFSPLKKKVDEEMLLDAFQWLWWGPDSCAEFETTVKHYDDTNGLVSLIDEFLDL